VTATILEQVPLAPFTTLGVGGPARYFIRAGSEKTVEEAIEFSRSEHLTLLVLGGGSNLLVADEGFPGVVIRVEIAGVEWMDEGSRVRLLAGAGEEWDKLVADCGARQLYGVECLSGIPGSVGGTPIQNVGAYGQEVATTLSHVDVYDLVSASFIRMTREECGFAYRTSVFNTTAAGRYIVLRVGYTLPKSGEPYVQYPELKNELAGVPQPTLPDVRQAVRRLRARKAMLIQPDDPNCRSAGSFFKNPLVTEEMFAAIQSQAGQAPPRYAADAGRIKTSAAWLIERAGIHRGYSKGRAGISSKHTLALINKGGATAAEIVALAREIRTRVEDRFGVRLMPEPVFAGFGDDACTLF
jgi:UDP-N-acetylmuramate dehydrogenase